MLVVKNFKMFFGMCTNTLQLSSMYSYASIILCRLVVKLKESI